MKTSSILGLTLLATLATTACGSDSSDGGPSGGASGNSSAGSSSAGDGNPTAGAAGMPMGADAKPAPMPLFSRGLPAFSSVASSTPAVANDGDPMSAWFTGNSLPGWIAYDLSGVSDDKKAKALIAWYAPKAGAYLMNAMTAPNDQAPVDYKLEASSAAGGGEPPASGWEEVATVTGNARNARQHLADLSGKNWLRMTITKGTAGNGVAIDLDVHSAPNGASDCWMLMGDSITNISTLYAFDDIPKLVNQAAAGRNPCIVPAAIGGSNTVTAQEVVDDNLRYFPGRFVTLAYGTNNHASDFDLEPLIAKVYAAGKVPAIPHMPWSSAENVQTEGPMINAKIDALYEKYPDVFRGPDLWEAFKERPDLIPAGDVHPNNAGQAELRKQWAQAISK